MEVEIDYSEAHYPSMDSCSIYAAFMHIFSPFANFTNMLAEYGNRLQKITYDL